MENKFDAIIVITAPLRTRIERLIAERGMTVAAAKRRIYSQLPLKSKIARADYIINNNTDLQNLHKQIDIILKKIYSNIEYFISRRK